MGASTFYTYGYGIAVDTNRNSYVTGYTTGSLDGQASSGTHDLYLVKYDINGAKQWTRLLGDNSGTTHGGGVAIDSQNNVYASGNTSANINGQTATGSNDLFITKYNSSGTIQWTRLLGVSGATSNGNRCSIDGSDNIYITGNTEGNLDSQTLTGTSDAVLTKYTSNGTRLWTSLLGVSGAETYGNRIHTDSSGNSYIAGNTNGNLSGESLTGTQDAFIAKFDSSGSLLWTRLLGASSATTDGTGIDIDSSGNVYITGHSDGSIDGQTMTASSGLFISKFSSGGTKLWTRMLGPTSVSVGCAAYDLAVNANGTSFITGYTNGDLNGHVVTGTLDIFLVQYDSNGNIQQTRMMGSTGYSAQSYGIALDSNDRSYIAGVADGIAGQSSTGVVDMFITTVLNE